MRFEDMTPEMVERAKGCETAEERTAFIRENGVELTDEQLEGISGGGWGDRRACPKDPTGKKRHKWVRTGREQPSYGSGGPSMEVEWRCTNCGLEKWGSTANLGF